MDHPVLTTIFPKYSVTPNCCVTPQENWSPENKFGKYVSFMGLRVGLRIVWQNSANIRSMGNLQLYKSQTDWGSNWELIKLCLVKSVEVD